MPCTPKVVVIERGVCHACTTVVQLHTDHMILLKGGSQSEPAGYEVSTLQLSSTALEQTHWWLHNYALAVWRDCNLAFARGSRSPLLDWSAA